MFGDFVESAAQFGTAGRDQNDAKRASAFGSAKCLNGWCFVASFMV